MSRIFCPRLTALAFACGLAACAGQTPAGAGFTPAAASAQLPQSVRPAGGQTIIYTANSYGKDVIGFSISASGNIAPMAKIKGLKTTFRYPDGIAQDSKGNLYVTSWGRRSVAVFPKGAHGDVRPMRIIHGSLTGLEIPNGIYVDPSDYLWVSDFNPFDITE